MNRREFIMAATAGLLMPLIMRQATPTGSGQPDPVDLGNGIVLVDYRAHPGEHSAVIGEIRNDREEMVDAPVVSLSWPRSEDGQRFTWAAPIIPVIGPGQSVPIFGPLPTAGVPSHLLETARFALCSPVVAGDNSSAQHALELEVRTTYERYRPLAFRGTGIVRNTGSKLARQIAVRGIVRDANDRIAGVTSTSFFPSIRPGAQKEFNVWVGEPIDNKASPLPLISGTRFTVEIRSGTFGPHVAPGCTYGQPWQ